MAGRALEASEFLKALSHEGRLLILCHLVAGERSVTELEALLGWRQAAVSQQLARLRLEGLVEQRRNGRTMHYHVADERVRRLLEVLHALFCGEPDPAAPR
jgi:ArsR family transcriptional regulator